MDKKGFAIGIDLGTTNSVGAYYDGKVQILTSSRADGLVPSVVFFQQSRKAEQGRGQILIGQTALDSARKDPTNAIFSIKRLMGRSFDEPKLVEARERLSYQITRAANSDDFGVRVLLGEKEYTPTEISAMILKQIKESAEKNLSRPVTHAVITVPAYFKERQRAATLQAGQQAGLIVKKIIDEPSAAAIAYGFDAVKDKRQRLLVFDLGGGTFDVSIILTALDPLGKNHFEVLDIRGDDWLGGDDFDSEIVREIVASIVQDYGIDPSDDKVFQLLAKQAAEKAKITLSSADEAQTNFPVAYKTRDGRVIDIDMTISRERFNELIKPYVVRCMKEVNAGLISQGFAPEDIDKVLLVGGSTLVPLVYETIIAQFGKERVQQANPYHSVAQGAAVLAAMLEGIQCPNPECWHVNDESSHNCEKCGEALATAVAVGGISLNEPTALSFGISAVRENETDAFEVIIPKGTPYPLNVSKTRIFETTRDNYMCIPVYEGLNPTASKNDKQGEIFLGIEDFSKAGANVSVATPVEVSMNYSRDREVILRIRIHGTSYDQEFRLRRDRPWEVAQVPRTDDKWRDDLDRSIQMAEGFRGKYMGFMESRELARLERDLERAQRAIDADNPIEGREAYGMLLSTLDSCGVASLLLMAERMYDTASPERAAKLSEAIGKIKESWFQNDKQAVAFLTKPLRTVIASELNARKVHNPAGNIQDFGGRLRVKP